MIIQITEKLGPWIWWVIGFILLGLEIVIPGVLLLWVGAAAIAIGAISLIWWDSTLWPWQAQIICFVILAFLSAFLGKRFMGGDKNETDQPLLNNRVEGLIGRKATLEEPIINGEGRIRLDDTLWMVNGPDLETGTKVVVTSAQSKRLTVTTA